jgi:glycosyltransferase involved in cell wall biosynthesis
MTTQDGFPAGNECNDVLFVTHRYPPNTGGIETHVEALATELTERGRKVTVFSADARGDLPRVETRDGVEVRRFRSFSPDDSLFIAPQIALAVRRVDSDVVHAHNYHAFPLFFASLGVTDETFVVSTHYHGSSADALRNRLLGLYEPLGRWALGRADRVISVSDWERERLSADLGVDSVVIPNGVEVKRLAEAEPETRRREYILCVGRLEQYKGVQHVIRALPELPGYELVVAGDGPHLETLQGLARRVGVAGRVDFLGYVDDARLPRLYAGAAVYVNLSTFEAYGITVAEALAASTPCVVNKDGLGNWCDCESVACITNEAVAEGIKNKPSRPAGHCDIESWEAVTDQILSAYSVL